MGAEYFSQGTLMGLVQKHLPEVARAETVSFQRIPSGKFNTSFFVQGAARDLVLRIAPPSQSVFLFYERDMMRQEPDIHTLLLAHSTVPVPRIVAYDNSHQLIDRDYMIMKRLPGRPLSEMEHVDYDAVLFQVGALLAQVHALTATRYGYLGAHHPMAPQLEWAPAFEIMWNKLVDDVVAVGHYDARESDTMRQLLRRHLQLFDRRVPASMLHMDIWQQNIMVDDRGRVSGLVDWDRVLWGDPEIEYAVLDYCGISEPAFWEGYGRQRDGSEEAEIRRVFYLLYELQKYIVIAQGRTNNRDRARRYKAQVIHVVNEAFGQPMAPPVRRSQGKSPA